MKRSELVVGAELFYQRSANYSPERARVLAVEPYREKYVRGDERFVATNKGNGVLVELPRTHNGGTYRKLVPLSSLKGPWAELYAEYERTQEEAARHRETVAKAREVAHDRAAVIVAALSDAGINTDAEGWDTPRIVLDLDEAQKLLNLLDSHKA